MRTNALAVANYFIEIAQNEGTPIRPLGLMKRVYIAHGFSLAIFDKPALDRRFDTVEAWRLGPVIPSVYHSFKHYGGSPITEKTTIFDPKCTMDEGHVSVITPELKDEEVRRVCDMVWKRYYDMTDIDLVNLLHVDGTPWELTYVPEKNREIPDSLTKEYYECVIERHKRDRGLSTR